MACVADSPEDYLGQIVGNGHCVAYVRAAAGAPHTSAWSRGALVRGRLHKRGTLIATFDEHGTYANATNGSSHAAIFIGHVGHGLVVYDQWVGRPVHERTIRFKGGNGPACDDGDRFYVVEV